MKIIIPTIGTRGDIQPYIALGLELQKAGQEIRLASHPCMRALVESYGLPFAPIGPDIDIAAETDRIRSRAGSWLTGFMRVMKFSFAMLEQSHTGLLELCRQADLVIVTHTAAGSLEADQLGMPHASVTLMTEAIPVRDPADSALKRALMSVAGAGMGLLMTRPLDQIRKRLGLPRMGPTGITSPVLNLIPLSPHVAAPNPLWEPRHQMTGYWFAPSPPGFEPQAALVEFLNSGEPPVVISLGAMAMSGADAYEAAQITITALQETGMRAVIQGWDEPLSSMEFPSGMVHAGPIPHDWLLARAGAFVHHGGFGSTAAGLRAGIPSLVVPHIIDQFLWGQRVFTLGVGPKPIARGKLTVADLAAALREMRENAEIRRKAQTLGECIRQEQGTQNALRLLRESFPAL